MPCVWRAQGWNAACYPAPPMATATSGRPRIFPFLLGIVLMAVTAALIWKGWSFYKLSMEERVEHPDFRTLRSSGFLGNGYGVVAALLIILNLSYLLRRLVAGRHLGSMRAWLDLHVFTGLLAAVLVSFHSAFQVRTPIAAVSAVSLAVVVVTGLIGRFLYALAPATEGRLHRAIVAVDAEVPDTRQALATAIESLPPPAVPANASLLAALSAVPRWRQVARQRREAIELLLPERRSLPKKARAAVKELLAAATVDARNAGVAALLRRWRGLHRFAALSMIAAVIFHAGVAWHYGYRWIFS